MSDTTRITAWYGVDPEDLSWYHDLALDMGFDVRIMDGRPLGGQRYLVLAVGATRRDLRAFERRLHPSMP